MTKDDEGDEVESPCTGVCVVDPAGGLCHGCGRTLLEIANWTRYSAHERRQVVAALAARVAAGNPPA